jgi:hypothetical protein
MVKLLQQLEDALRNYNAAEQYFENAYISYRLAKKHLDEQEALVAEIRGKIEIESEQVRATIDE